MELDVLSAELAKWMEAEPAVLGSGEVVLAVERIVAQSEALASRTLASFETYGEWAEDGARSVPAWVAAKCRLPQAVPKRQLRLGRACRELPCFEEAWGTGDVSGSHVEMVDKVRRFETEDELARDEELLCASAQTLTFTHFCRAVEYWEQQADPNGAEKSAEEMRSRRDASLVKSFEGMWLGKMTLDPISGAIVSNEWQRIEDELFEADWAEAKESLGREPTLAELCRTPAQRRADALVEMAIRSATVPEGGRRPTPLFTVLVGYETLRGRMLELAQGATLTPGSLVPWLEGADIERAVFGPKDRVQISERSRLFTGATRRGLEVRDRGCTHPLCDEQVERCQADHVQPFAQGGLTVQENGRRIQGVSATSSLNRSAGVSHPSVLRGRVLRRCAI